MSIHSWIFSLSRDDGRDEEDIKKYTEIIRMQADQLQENQERIHSLYEEVGRGKRAVGESD